MRDRLGLGAVILAGCLLAPALAQNMAASFDGNGTGSAQVADNATFVPTTGITVEAWAYRSANNSSGYRSIVRKNAQSFNASYLLRLNDGKPQMVIKTAANGTTGPTSLTTFPTNSWHHLAGTFDNSTIKIYMDGALIASRPD